MKEELTNAFIKKTMTAQEAVRLVKDGGTVFVGTNSSLAYGLLDALAERENELKDVTIACSMIMRPSRALSCGKFRVLSYFLGGQERKSPSLEFTSVHLHQVDIWCHETAKPDVAFFEVSLPDENGFMSLGPSGVAVGAYIRDTAKTIILQINKNTPYVLGENNLIHITDAAAIIYHDQELVENPDLPVDEVIKDISKLLLDYIPDGACIQLGLGGLATAVGFGLKDRNDLGCHTEMISNSIMDLMKTGVINNSRKNFMPGKTVAAFSYGSKALYDFLDRNKNVYFMPFPKVNNPVNIAKNDNMISVNTALSADLFGQVNADNLAGKQYSAIGGQLDFVRGAQMSKGGKSFIAMQSTIENSKVGRLSRIVSRFPLGTAVTTPRADVQYIATEFGCINLKPLTMKDRVRAMISLAHPDFRPQLTDEAKEAGLL